jgi:cellobiose epimerase
MPETISLSEANPVLEQSLQRLQKNLLQNILPFWYPDTLDKENGGYHLNHDHRGRFKGVSDRMLVTQARMLWFYAYLYNNGYNEQKYLDAAEHGFRYLRDVMWDKEYGGFYWMVDPAGQPKNDVKHLYGQGFALYGLSEYAIATDRDDVLELAHELFATLEAKAHDEEYGGYVESFTRNWAKPDTDDRNVLAVPHTFKLMNTHLHLMEPLTTYFQASEEEWAKERLLELIQIQSNAVVRKHEGACTDKFTRDWQPVSSPEFDVVSYGHDLENIWLLMHACDAAGLHNGPFMNLYRTLFDTSYRYGYDQGNGGFYYTGPFGQNATNTTKIWWVQAEALVAALEMYFCTEEKLYFDCFTHTLNWIDTMQTDWQHGDWHANVPDSRDPKEGKAHSWKGPYHNGRAMIRCIKRIEESFGFMRSDPFE